MNRERPVARTAKSVYRRKLPHYQRPNATLFINFSTARRWILPVAARRIVLETCLRGHGAQFWLHAAVVMPDHVHLLLTPQHDGEGHAYGTAQIMSGIKGAAAHAVNRLLNRTGRVWEAESFDRIVRSDESVRQKAEYICQNPVRAGVVSSEDEYPWLWREWVEGAAVESEG